MATVTREIQAPPAEVWATLADPDQYAGWVVGTKTVRGADGHWPARGARFHHTVGVWPLHIRDDTKVLESDAPRRLVLEARIRPLVVARVELDLLEVAAGTRVVMTEYPTAPLVVRLAARLVDPIVHARNVEALRRLDSLMCPVAR
jgi:uncharacterized protein YndB with AHSA1/START domain